MRRSAYVLVGGRSSRMGRDKALLPLRGEPLAVRAAREAESAAGRVFLVGDPGRCAGLGWPVLADLRPGEGPLAGIETALHHGAGDWNLVLACDMPLVSSVLFEALFDAAASVQAQCLAPLTAPGRLEPLCALYHRSALETVRAALDAGVRKVRDAVSRLEVAEWRAPRELEFLNLNTPEQWHAHLGGSSVG